MPLDDRKRHLRHLQLLLVTAHEQTRSIQREQFAVSPDLSLYIHPLEGAGRRCLELLHDRSLVPAQRSGPGCCSERCGDLHLFGYLGIREIDDVRVAGASQGELACLHRE